MDEEAALELEAAELDELEPALPEVCGAVVVDDVVRMVAVEAPEVDWPDEVAVALPPPPAPPAGLVRSMVVVSWLTSVGRVASTLTLAASLAAAELYVVLEKPHTERISSMSRGRVDISD